ncbi:MAG TPA: RodZ domain-containing protein [Fontimonas sp.]
MNTETSDPSSSADSPAQTPLPSPGAMIREARERVHYSIDDMVAHTKLSRATLQALERDDAQALEPVYIRGYFRKCAKVLELDEERLIAAYQARVAPREPEAPAKLRLASGTELGSSSRLPVSIGLIFAVIAVVGCAFLWFARDQKINYPMPGTLADAPVVIATAAPTADAALEMPQAPSDPQDAAAGDPGTGVASSSAVDPALAGTDAAASQAATVAPGTLHLRYQKTSWVRVDDATGATLINETRPEGNQDTVNGQLPLSVFLGYAPGVEVEFEGKRIDISAFARGNNTARFTLPTASTPQPAAQ